MFTALLFLVLSCGKDGGSAAAPTPKPGPQQPGILTQLDGAQQISLEQFAAEAAQYSQYDEIALGMQKRVKTVVTVKEGEFVVNEIIEIDFVSDAAFTVTTTNEETGEVRTSVTERPSIERDLQTLQEFKNLIIKKGMYQGVIHYSLEFETVVETDDESGAESANPENTARVIMYLNPALSGFYSPTFLEMSGTISGSSVHTKAYTTVVE